VKLCLRLAGAVAVIAVGLGVPAGVASADPPVCVPGTYLSGGACVATDPGFFTAFSGLSSEIPCAPGTYQPSGGQTQCLPAPVDTYVAETSAVTATPCPPGTGTNGQTGEVSCQVEGPTCNAGSYPSGGSCVPADPGFFVASTGESSETPCPAGTYQPSSGEISCVPATPGNFVPTVGAMFPIPCSAGTYQPAGDQSSCLPARVDHFVAATDEATDQACPPGTGTNGLTGQVSCQVEAPPSCTPGSYLTGGSCVPADPGFFVASAGQSSEILCPVGHYQPVGGQTGCLDAPVGSFVSTVGATSATACSVGTYQPESSQIGCEPAPAGSVVSSTGAGSTTPCAPGTYQPDTNQGSCLPARVDPFVSTSGAAMDLPCAPGTGTNGLTGQVSCQVEAPPSCNPGSYLSGGSCVPASPGFFVTSAGQSSETPCPSGTYQPAADQSSCLLAGANRFTPAPEVGAVTDQPCPLGTWTNGLTGQSECQARPEPDHLKVGLSVAATTTGQSFTVTITGQNAANQTVTGFAGPVTLTDTSGSLTVLGPIVWSNGVGTVSASVGTAISRDRVTATDPLYLVPPTGTSADVIAVTSTTLDHFHISALPATVSTGDQMTFQVTALDAGSQTITGFSGPLSLTDATDTLNVVSVVWSGGVATVAVSVGAASPRDRIAAVSGSVSAVTTVFNVLGPVASLRVVVSPATTVSQNSAATVTVTAVDSSGQVVTGYTGPVTLTDASGAMQVLDPGSWLAGVDTETVSFPSVIARDRVTASDGNGHSGQSAVFVVAASTGNGGGAPA